MTIDVVKELCETTAINSTLLIENTKQEAFDYCDEKVEKFYEKLKKFELSDSEMNTNSANGSENWKTGEGQRRLGQAFGKNGKNYQHRYLN